MQENEIGISGMIRINNKGSQTMCITLRIFLIFRFKITSISFIVNIRPWAMVLPYVQVESSVDESGVTNGTTISLWCCMHLLHMPFETTHCSQLPSTHETHDLAVNALLYLVLHQPQEVTYQNINTSVWEDHHYSNTLIHKIIQRGSHSTTESSL